MTEPTTNSDRVSGAGRHVSEHATYDTSGPPKAFGVAAEKRAILERSGLPPIGIGIEGNQPTRTTPETIQATKRWRITSRRVGAK